jgi:hypothetical protein
MGDRLTRQECWIIIKQNEAFGLSLGKANAGDRVLPVWVRTACLCNEYIFCGISDE